jgi:NADH-quinone oxidoreductase subunit A
MVSRVVLGTVVVRRCGPVACSAVSEFLREYSLAALLAVLAVVLIGVTLTINRILRPDRPSVDKAVAYESGVDPVGAGWSQSQVRYYLYALLFVVFDVEAVFLFPWAVRLETYGVFGLIEMGVFVFILLLGLLYAWKKKVLRWA